MKPILLLCICIISFCSFAQKGSQFGFKTGLNLSKFSASINSEPSNKPGFHLGVFAKMPIGEKIFFRTEFIFSGQGQKDNYITPPSTSIGSTTTTVNYFNVPLLFETTSKFFVQFGGQVGFLLSAKEEGKISGTKIDDDLRDLMKPTDFSAVFGVGLNATDKVQLGARYQLGLTNIFEKPSNNTSFPDVKNRVLHFFIGFNF